jgi:NAD(P)-dependent dehydrogenase (short-subunit alcohol dehydrogenase family)
MKTAFITGTSSGLGHGLAAVLIAQGERYFRIFPHAQPYLERLTG